MTFEQFISEWEFKFQHGPKHFRKGQSLMNYLADVWPSEYEKMVSIHYYDRTDIDCYYNDDLIPNTLQHLQDKWYKFPK